MIKRLLQKLLQKLKNLLLQQKAKKAARYYEVGLLLQEAPALYLY